MASTINASNDAALLVSEIERLSEKKNALPSVHQMFSIGCMLFQMKRRQADNNVPAAYQQLIASLPESFLRVVFKTFHKATSTLLEQSQSLDELAQAAEALCGLLYKTEKLCQLVYSKEWMSLLASLYDKFVLKEAPSQSKQAVLTSISFLLLDGLFVSKKGQESIEEKMMNAIRAMEEHSSDCLRDLQSWQGHLEPLGRTLESSLRKLPMNDNVDDSMQQREYIFSMLESARQHEAKSVGISGGDNNTRQEKSKTAPKTISAADELERRIQQVKSILPDFGEGFIESALSLNAGNVETTVATLLNDPSQYPPVLRALDRSLPRRRKVRSKEEVSESVEARKLVKVRVAVEQKQEEAKYKALVYMDKQQRESEEQPVIMQNEYDDDYDDQYDEIDVKLGGADDGFYDFEQVKLYNQVARADEAEGSFWEDNRNLNRAAPASGDDGGKKYRGADKIKGGRVVGPDGKIVKKQGRGKKNKNPNSNPNSSGSQGPAGDVTKQTKPTGKKGNANGPNQSSEQPKGKPKNKGGANGPNQSSEQPKGKPKTKPRSDNRINRQRDRKQKGQGTFGVQ